ncbi:hypothetical protein INS49_000444 [Diaporthe citri]|uniref:uncharacterized protein n=1 Tax=Diaporthe citri TaxID=83186 RepID=UPI001C7FDB7D|nr:uncharacterized protein INS49_000444 [Diaporthe citri]KAG6366268.1 hypothetical protein INS49_000444 [Diaporthe citri]
MADFRATTMEADESCMSPPRRRISYRALMLDYGWVDRDILEYRYSSSGTVEDPFRGVAMIFFSSAPLFGPSLGPIVAILYGTKRLPMSLVGCVAIPIGLFWFAWTNDPSSSWLISIAAQAPFGFGFVLVYISIQNYLVDAYTIYAASVLAAKAMLKSVFGAAFPLFTGS